MGACEFSATAKGKTARDAFQFARAEAQYESGHGGYTGTIAEKHEFVVVGSAPTIAEAIKVADAHQDEVDDKWGPAGCVRVGEPGPDGLTLFYFYGWASS